MAFRPPAAAAVLLTGLLPLLACEPGAGNLGDPASASDAPGTVRIAATDFEFDAPERIPSGWTTIRFVNEGEQEHFAYLYRLPDDVDFARYRREVLTPFTDVWSDYAAGDLDREGVQAGLASAMPGWFFTDVTPAGGAALTEAGETSVVTLRLEPGTYVVECYVKTPQGTWHTERGMVRELEVTEEENGRAAPDADAEIRLANYTLTAPDELAAGEHTLAVHVEDTPEGFSMHDVNLFRLDEDTSVDEIVAWMDWLDLDQFRAPAPGYSLGGLDSMVEGRTGYVTVDLEPGRYAWVSEGYGARGMAEEFTVR